MSGRGDRQRWGKDHDRGKIYPLGGFGLAKDRPHRVHGHVAVAAERDVNGDGQRLHPVDQTHELSRSLYVFFAERNAR